MTTITAQRATRAPLADGETRTYTKHGAYVQVQRTRFTYTVRAGFIGGPEIRELASTHATEASANTAARRIAEQLRDDVRVDLIPAALTPAPIAPARRAGYVPPKGHADEMSDAVAMVLLKASDHGGTVKRDAGAPIHVLRAAEARGWVTLTAPAGTWRVTGAVLTDAGRRRLVRWLAEDETTAALAA